MNGKGAAPRPLGVDGATYRANWDRIFAGPAVRTAVAHAPQDLPTAPAPRDEPNDGAMTLPS